MLPIPVIESGGEIKKLPNNNKATANEPPEFDHWHLWEVDNESKK